MPGIGNGASPRNERSPAANRSSAFDRGQQPLGEPVLGCEQGFRLVHRLECRRRAPNAGAGARPIPHPVATLTPDLPAEIRWSGLDGSSRNFSAETVSTLRGQGPRARPPPVQAQPPRSPPTSRVPPRAIPARDSFVHGFGKEGPIPDRRLFDPRRILNRFPSSLPTPNVTTLPRASSAAIRGPATTKSPLARASSGRG